MRIPVQIFDCLQKKHKFIDFPIFLGRSRSVRIKTSGGKTLLDNLLKNLCYKKSMFQDVCCAFFSKPVFVMT